MKNQIIALIILLAVSLPQCVFSQTDVSGSLSENTTPALVGLVTNKQH